MIERDSLVSVGELLKPHGVKGEITAGLDDGITPGMLSCMILEMDGIPVPFFVESFRPKGASWLVKFDGIDDDTAAMRVARHTVWALKAEVPDAADGDDGLYLSDLAGYTLLDAADGLRAVGRITGFDDSTENILLFVERPDGSDALVPYSDDLLEDVDTGARTISMNLPRGLFDLQDGI